MTPPTKRCPRCQTTKSLTEFSGASSSYCRPCMAAYTREYRRRTYPQRQLLAARIAPQRHAQRALERQIIAEFRQTLEED